MTKPRTDGVRVRPALLEDAPALTELLRDFLRFEGKAEASELSVEQLTDWAFGPDPAFDLLIAEAEGVVVGYVAFYRAFTLFKGGPVLLIENLFVAEAARRLGVGRRLVEAAAEEARRRGYQRIELHVRSDNPESHAFYESLGFFAPGEHVYRIEDAALAGLARGEK